MGSENGGLSQEDVFFFGSYVLNHHIWGRPIRQIHGVW
jgi:hypothetical protein